MVVIHFQINSVVISIFKLRHHDPVDIKKIELIILEILFFF